MWLNIDVKKSLKEKKHILVGKPGEVRVGCAIRIGSFYASSYSSQDWWQTTEIIEILDVNKDKTEIRFKTSNSEYIAKSF
jgi:hypothetical protein